VPPLPNLRVVRSRIHGYGVVARHEIRAGELVADVDGVVYSREQLGDDTYCLWVNDDCYLDMVDQTRWINHSCEPNCEVEAEPDGQGGAWARITATRDIPAGEEITYHYAFAQELAEPCTCGSPTCLGWIVDPDELGALEQRLARERSDGGNGTPAENA